MYCDIACFEYFFVIFALLPYLFNKLKVNFKYIFLDREKITKLNLENEKFMNSSIINMVMKTIMENISRYKLNQPKVDLQILAVKLEMR